MEHQHSTGSYQYARRPSLLCWKSRLEALPGRPVESDRREDRNPPSCRDWTGLVAGERRPELAPRSSGQRPPANDTRAYTGRLLHLLEDDAVRSGGLQFPEGWLDPGLLQYRRIGGPNSRRAPASSDVGSL